MGFDANRIRNIAVIGQGSAGKTSLVEAMLFNSGTIDRLGRVDDGNTVTDFEAEEIERRISISSAMAFCEWNGHKLNIVDTPGYIFFIEDTKCVLYAVDGVVMVFDAVSGIKAETGKLWQFTESHKLPRIIFINKLDREDTDFGETIKTLEKLYKVSAVPLSIPLGQGGNMEAVIDLLKMKVIRVKDKDTAEEDVPENARSQAEEFRKQLVEKVAELDDTLLEKYLEGGDLTDEEIRNGLKAGFIAGSIIPVLCGSSTKNIGVHCLMDAVISYLPSPIERAEKMPISGKNPKTDEEVTRKPVDSDPLSIRVFKTIADPFAGKLTLFRVFSGVLRPDSNVYNSTKDTKEKMGNMFYLIGKKQVPIKEVRAGDMGVVAKLKEAQTGDTLCDPSNPIVFEPIKLSEPMISYAIAPKSREDEEKVSMGLQRLLEEDPSLKFHRDTESKEMILGGTGQLHLEVTLQKLKRKFGVEVEMKTPKIPYRETIKKAASAQGKYKKQTGGRGQYGDCWIKIEPLPRGSGFEFVDQIVGGVIPRQYIPAVEKGLVEKMKEGLLAGYPLVDIRATLYDGSYHSVDSSEMAFKIAASLALQKAAQEAKLVLLEPIVKVEVITPEEYLGNVIGDLNAKRGKVQGVEPQPDGSQKVTAFVPMAEMLTYANQLNSLTSGQGVYTMEASHYEEVPSHIAQKIIEERAKERQKEK